MDCRLSREKAQRPDQLQQFLQEITVARARELAVSEGGERTLRIYFGSGPNKTFW